MHVFIMTRLLYNNFEFITKYKQYFILCHFNLVSNNEILDLFIIILCFLTNISTIYIMNSMCF